MNWKSNLPTPEGIGTVYQTPFGNLSIESIGRPPGYKAYFMDRPIYVKHRSNELTLKKDTLDTVKYFDSYTEAKEVLKQMYLSALAETNFLENEN